VKTNVAKLNMARDRFSYRSGRSPDWLKMKNPACAAVSNQAPLGPRDGGGPPQPSDGRMTQNRTPLLGPTCLGAQT
jgi:hypothetical protein